MNYSLSLKNSQLSAMKMKIIQRERSNIVLLLIFTYFIFNESSAITDITKEELKHSVIEIVILLSFANVHKLIAGIIRVITLKTDTIKKRITIL